MALHNRTLDFRTIDGSNNNLADPTLNQANTVKLLFVMPSVFVPGRLIWPPVKDADVPSVGKAEG